MIKKAVLLHKAVWALVEHCGVISWLSSILLPLYGSGIEEQQKFALIQLPTVLEVYNHFFHCLSSNAKLSACYYLFHSGTRLGFVFNCVVFPISLSKLGCKFDHVTKKYRRVAAKTCFGAAFRTFIASVQTPSQWC